MTHNYAAQLPNGKYFESWEQPQEWTRTLYVNQSHPRAADANSGTAEEPFKTIDAAARVLQPGERVLIENGIYREHVAPRISGSGPNAMIGFEAAPGAEVVIRGSEIYEGEWTPSRAKRAAHRESGAAVWEAKLPAQWFIGYNPFATPNKLYEDQSEDLFSGPHGLSDPMLRVYLTSRGLVFQDGQRLRQVYMRSDLLEADGTFWAEPGGRSVLVRPLGDVAPQSATFEMAVREQVFASEVYGLSYIAVRGLTIEHAADGFPRPQAGALSASRGQHWIIEDCTVRHANACGIDVGNQSMYEPDESAGHHIIRRNVVEDCGVNGICGTGKPAGLLVEDNLVQRCGWQNIANYEECAAIKFHVTTDALIRRNLLLDNVRGCGIWLDWDCRNSRVCYNVIRDTSTPTGAIFVEASRSKDANLIDHNIILDTKGHGVYAHDGDRLRIAHNLIAGCSGFGVHLGWSDPQRWCRTQGEARRGSSGRKNRIEGNLFVQNARQMELDNPGNTSDFNGFGEYSEELPGAFRMRRPEENLDLATWQEFHNLDTQSTLLPITLQLEGDALLCVNGEVPQLPNEVAPPLDVNGQQRFAEHNAAGPMAQLKAGETARISLDPRHMATQEQ